MAEAAATTAAETVQLVVNGQARELPAAPERSLLDALRDELGLMGPKPGCGEGVCGACTVLVDGEPVRSCRTWLSEVAGHAVTTIEALPSGGRLHPVQQAFLDAGAFQCGYCTPGMVMASVALIDGVRSGDGDGAAPLDDAAIRAGLETNVCRCGTYVRILEAVRAASAGAPGSGAGDGTDLVASGRSRPQPAPPPDDTPIDLPRPRRPWDSTPTSERDWFEVLPPGLVVVREAAPSENPGWRTTWGAWLHVGADGRVTAFTGKVDGGQDNRTALTLRVAEELRVPVDAVALVMGDTDVCPHDIGTFGSRSMPDAGEELRRAAGSARETLVGLAAKRLGHVVEDLEARDGRVVGADGDAAEVTYGDLVRDLREVVVATGEPSLTPGPAERVVGRPMPRLTRRSIVTGAKLFPSDVARPGMLHGRVVRPRVQGATLESVDTSAADGPGVTIVRDGDFVGVAAATPAAARRAAKAIVDSWTAEQGPSDATIDAYLRAHPMEDPGWEGSFRRESGDVEAALAAAPIRLENTYTTAYIAHVPMETHAAVAEWSADGRLTIWTGTQVPFGIREEVASALGLEEARVRVIVPDLGGGFGGKHAGEVAIEAARLSRAAKAPVKVRWSREDEFRFGYLRPAAIIDVRAAAERDGRITALEMRNTNSGMFGLVGPYQVPNQRLTYQPAQSPLAQGSYRALAATANHFARESLVDELAEALEIDPLELRLSHLDDDRLAAVLRAVAERIVWTGERPPGVGCGIAGGVEKGARVATAVDVHVGSDRRVELLRIVTAFECGSIVNPDGLMNQVQGATVMGIGGALFEAVRFEDGVLTNASLTDYRVPRFGDVPPIEVILLDRRDLPSAGAGETPIIAVAPAIAGAIYAASGVRLRSMPLVPDGRVP